MGRVIAKTLRIKDRVAWHGPWTALGHDVSRDCRPKRMLQSLNLASEAQIRATRASGEDTTESKLLSSSMKPHGWRVNASQTRHHRSSTTLRLSCSSAFATS